MVKFLEKYVDKSLESIAGKSKMIKAIIYSILMIALTFGTAELLMKNEGKKMGKWRGSMLVRMLYNVIMTIFHHHIHYLDKQVATATLATIFFSVYMKYGLEEYSIWFIYFTLANIWIWETMDNLEDEELKINSLKELEQKILELDQE